MRFELSDDQALLLTEFDRLAQRHAEVPHGDLAYVRYSAALQEDLAEAGFLAIGGEEGFGPVDAALLVERIARLPVSVEAAASALVGPLLGRTLTGPLALCEGVGRPTRYLPQARHAVILDGSDMLVADLDPDAGVVRARDSVIAYPLGALAAIPAGAERLDPALAREVLCRWRIAIAVEAAGLMGAALDRTVVYVKERRQFKQTLGHFQAVQHRLAVARQIVSGSFLLAMRAADSLDPAQAATAALYAQQNMRSVIYDCHQFHGAMGLTLEYPLHLWTYRLKFLQGELGGKAGQADALAGVLWPAAAAAAARVAEAAA